MIYRKEGIAMKHPVWDRILLFLCALCALCGAVAIAALLTGIVSAEGIIAFVNHYAPYMDGIKGKVVMIAAAALLVILAVMLISAIFPSRKKRSSTFAAQRNENGTVRISLKALETLVQKCLNQHAELKVVSSSLFSDEESVRVDVHINMQTDISMPLAISALQKQVKKYLEACSGVVIQEVRIFVEGTMPATAETANSPYALPMSIIGAECEALEPAQEDEMAIGTAAEAAPFEAADEPAAVSEDEGPQASEEPNVVEEGLGE